MPKTFILGVGAQRSGSTWLHSQLNKNASINMGFCKEYHVFDTLFAPQLAPKPSGFFRKIGQARARSVRKELRRLSFIRNPQTYFRFFDRLYRRHDITEAVGDMTPSYSMLDARAFRFIRDGLTGRGFRVKVIFVMRDPVERIWSMVHQASKIRRLERAGREPLPVSIESFTNPYAALRTTYDRTMKELEKVFPPEDIFYGFYENFFTAESYSGLGRFLGLKLAEPDFGTVRNAGLSKRPLDPAIAREAVEFYAPTYAFVLERFGPRVTSLWDGYGLHGQREDGSFVE